MKKTRWILTSIFFLLISCSHMVLSVQAGTIYDSPYVTFSPDGQAFTTNAGERNYEWYDKGTTVTTGITSSRRALQIGEHYYKADRSGSVPISRWEVSYRTGTCCHSAYPLEDNPYHGISFTRQSCAERHQKTYYYSGWTAYCADCKEPLTHMYIYMSKEAAKSITELDMGNDLIYYYLCPVCNNLEQGVRLEKHTCDKISWNRYKVSYDVNKPAGTIIAGYMMDSIHMYNNATEYEGNVIAASTHLTKNTYTCTGYEFTGWNTKPDGTGEKYKDGQEISDLTTENYDGTKGIVTLYAQWKKSESTLNINPNGGKYDGKSDISSFTKTYLSALTINTALITPPSGYKVKFDVKGGNAVSDITGTQTFVEWSMSQPFTGRLVNNTYYYLGKDGTSDTITAVYKYNSITLPAATKSGSSFGGWYYDSACTNPAGVAGDKIIPNKDLTLYAKWVELVLTSKDNYSANGGKGAVDLSWTQNDGYNKTYLLYQSQDNKNWTKISNTNDISNSNSVNVTFRYSGASQTYTIPYTGIYTITAYGAQGGNYGGYTGGNGGSVKGQFWLKAGEVVTYTIGGQNGYNGGGSADMFANGGGCTTVSALKETILIAGGGGGASSMGNGGAGGSEESNIFTGTSGQSGGAGGGGGYRGGSAGQRILHWHDNNVCRHNHTGDSVNGGGCYTVQKICGSTSFNSIYDGSNTYYGNKYYDSSTGTWKSDGFCARCGTKGSCAGHTDTFYKYVCTSCGKDFGRSKPSSCGNQYGYTLGCGRTEEYICGYTNGQVLTSKPAYGGSNYVNTKYATNYSSESGKQDGNGYITITSVSIGYLEVQTLKGVTATDKAAPDMVGLSSLRKTALSESQISISWQKPTDNGTVYYHRAETYLQGSTGKLCDSNVTTNTLTSGIMGYYYLVDNNAATTVSSVNGTLLKQPDTPSVKVTLTAEIQYFHVSAVDIAGNVSGTQHVQIGKADLEVAWNLGTEKISIAPDHDNIYPGLAADTYYVKSDGVTSFSLSFNSNVAQAQASYQVNKTIFHVEGASEEQEYIVHTPNHAITGETIVTKAAGLEKSVTGTGILQDAAYTVTTRRNSCRQLHILQKFTLSAAYHGRTIRVTPIAGADFQGTVQYSDWNSDLTNSIWLIGDGEAPVISGMGVLEGLDLINRSDGSMTLQLTASDSLSGVRDFYVEITNTDNYITKTYKADGENSIRIEITKDEPVFSGDFSITVCAVDNVGNARTETFGTTAFGLTTQVTRILAPHTPVFKAGESGILNIITYGYADRVEVKFPAEMAALNPNLNTTFYYEDTPAYRHEENLQFMVPLGTPENACFTITVRAYKGDKKLEEHPSLSTVGVEGSVLGEIRTRLR